MNYKKSLLSLVTIMALGNTVIADDSATYLPLASDAVDSTWVLFGVNGFSTGVPSSISTGTSSFSPGTTEYQDTVVTDDMGTLSADGLVRLQSLNDQNALALSVGINKGTIVNDPAEAMRTIYFKVNKSVPNVKLDYKVSLEGKAIEINLGGTIYTATINEAGTWSNPITATTGSAASTATLVHSKPIVDMLDFNFSNNPLEPKYYDSTLHLDTTGTTASFYHFDAISQQWKVYQKSAPAAAQDFTSLTRGNAYWGRADRNESLGALVINAAPAGGGSVGLVLGRPTALSGIPNPAMYQNDSNVSTLTTGWNMLSFDDNKPYIRHAATGLVLTNVSATAVLKIIDDSGLNAVTTDINATSTAVANLATAGDAININKNITAKKQLGLLPQNFNVKAFPGSANGTVILISDRKFAVTDTNATSAAIVVKTLNNKDPYVNGVAETVVNDLDFADINASTSAYGEYATIVDFKYDLNSTNDIAGAGGDFSKIMFSAANPAVSTTTILNHTVPISAAVGTATLADVETAIELIGDAGTTTDPSSTSPMATQIDTNFDGAADMLVVAYAKPYSLKDYTFTRAFTVTNTTNADSVPITVSGTVAKTVIPTPGGITAPNLAALIAAEYATTNVEANATSGSLTSMVVASTTNSNFDVKDAASRTLNFLVETTSSHDIAKGAVEGVYSLDNIAKLPVMEHEWVLSFTGKTQPATGTDAADGNITITDSNGTARYSSDINATTTVTANTAVARKAWFDLLVSKINTVLGTIGEGGFAVHDFDSDIDSFTSTKIYVSGVYVNGIDMNISADQLAGIEPAATDSQSGLTGTLGTAIATGDLVADLKTNPVYSPNYANYGPLYTLRNSGAGYDVRGMLKATTEMDSITSTTASTIAWNSVDITRNENEWFINNEFDVFSIDHTPGYWVYLQPKAADNVAIVSATFTQPVYTYYFSNDSTTTPAYGTTNTLIGGQLAVTITGLDDAVAGSAYATIGGEEVQLERSGTSTTFTADISSYALSAFSPGSSYAITVRAVNGKGIAVSASGSVSIDYTAPTAVTATMSGSSISLGATGGDVQNFYVFNNYIPEVEAARTTALISTIAASGGNSGVYSGACSAFTFGTTNYLRIVAADGAMNSANLSAAKELVYASTLKGAGVLSHTYGATKSQSATIYNTSCANPVTQVAPANAGVSLATLSAGQTTSMSFVPLFRPDGVTYVNFTQDVAWTANYEITDGAGAVVQIQNAEAYASKPFFLIYNGIMYTGTFPASQVAADASIGAPMNLTASTAANTTLAP